METDDKVLDALDELEASFAHFAGWMAGLYDPARGGFHLAPSALTDPGQFPCTIDTTAQAVSILESADLLPRVPALARERLANFFRSRQDADGYFRDPVPGMTGNERLLGRALGYAVKSLASLDSEPWRRLPDREATQSQFPALASPEAFGTFLRDLDWSNPYRSGDEASVVALQAARFEEPRRGEILAVFWRFMDGMQSAATGLWGRDAGRRDHDYVSGVMKLSSVHQRFRRPVPDADRVLASILWVLENDHHVDASYCYVRNPLTALQHVLPHCDTRLTQVQIAAIIQHSTRHHLRFAQPDGGFSRSRERAMTGEDGMVLGLGEAEGDMNAGTQAIHTVRHYCYELAGVRQPPLRNEEKLLQALSR